LIEEGLSEDLEYKRNWRERVKKLNKIARKDLPSVDVRNKESRKMIDEYVNERDKFPEPYWLSRLATYIMAGDLKLKDKDKATNTEYPILSYRQIKRRKRRDITVKGEYLDYLNSKYVVEMDSLAKIRNPNDYDG